MGRVVAVATVISRLENKRTEVIPKIMYYVSNKWIISSKLNQYTLICYCPVQFIVHYFFILASLQS